jgi:DUF4097 and DUF4098 domain-containing protein YvlB
MKTTQMIVVAIAVTGFAATGWADVTVNKSIDVRDGKTSNSGYSTVNGSIDIGDQCTVKGDCNSVNGRIRIGDESAVRDLRVVNGSIRVGDEVAIDGNVTTVNGRVSIEGGSSVDGEVTTVNGSIELDGATVSDDVSTINGNIELMEGAVVKGDIIIRDANNWSSKTRRVSIYLTGDSRVEGDIINEDKDAKVTVHLEDGSEILGETKRITLKETSGKDV